jgi:hypothetical protein
VALSTYSDLQTAVADWLVRTDLTARIPDFIRLVESRLNRELRVREMITQETGSITTNELAVPTDFVETFRFMLDTASEIPLEYRPIEDWDLRVSGGTSGQPRGYSVSGTEFRFYPTPDTTYAYTLDYYAKIPALSDTNTSNWLLAKAPDVYLYGSLVEASAFLLDDGRVSLLDSKFMAARNSLKAAESRARRTSSPRRAKVLV